MANPFSHHIFIFPFKWDSGPQEDAFMVRTNFAHLDEKMKEQPCCSLKGLRQVQWQPFHFKIQSPKDYNEWGYFYPPVRNVLFTRGESAEKIVRQYHIHKSENTAHLELRIQLKPELCCTVLQLEIEEVTLTFYETGVGFLGLHLNNYHHDSEEEVLKINDFGRRIYPQFLGNEAPLTDAPKGVFLADSISIYAGDTSLKEENFSKFDDLKDGHDQIVAALIPEHIRAFLPAFLKFSKYDAARSDVLIESLVDDRMFTICWVGNKRWAKSLNSHNYTDPENVYARFWHRLIFLDGKWPGLANDALLSSLNKNHTNPRWADSGTLYGITRYSFVALTDDGFGKDVVLPHTQSMYFQIALLCLLQRASMLRFSEEIARLVGKTEQRGYLEQAKSLYKKYLHFINKIYFREVTPHEQGIELYRMVQEKMEIPRDVESLKTEIAEFHQLLELESNAAQTQAMNTLTVVGSGLLVPSLILAYYGISEFQKIEDANKEIFTWWTFLLATTGCGLAVLTAWAWVKNRWWLALIGLILTLAIFATAAKMPHCFSPKTDDRPCLCPNH